MLRSTPTLLLLTTVTCAAPVSPTTPPAAAPESPTGTTETAAPTPEAPRSFAVDVRGEGPPILLIPGLGCGGDVWDETVAWLADEYEVHVVTLAGFAGQPSLDGPLLPNVRADLVEYVRARGLVRPAVVGHSLGGFMALWLASTEPELFGPIVAVDGLPSLAAAMGLSGDRLQETTRTLQAQMGALEPDAFRAQNRATLSSMITREEDVARVAKTSDRSDPATVGRAMGELLLVDLREDVAAIRSPVLLFGPGVGSPAQRAHVEEIYRAQMAAIPEHEIVFAEGARHFIMLDAREEFRRELHRFLAAHPPGPGSAAGDDPGRG